MTNRRILVITVCGALGCLALAGPAAARVQRLHRGVNSLTAVYQSAPPFQEWAFAVPANSSYVAVRFEDPTPISGRDDSDGPCVLLLGNLGRWDHKYVNDERVVLTWRRAPSRLRLGRTRVALVDFSPAIGCFGDMRIPVVITVSASTAVLGARCTDVAVSFYHARSDLTVARRELRKHHTRANQKRAQRALRIYLYRQRKVNAACSGLRGSRPGSSLTG